MLRKQVIEKVKKFQEKLQRIGEDKEKYDQERINVIMEKYNKTQENLVFIRIFLIKIMVSS